MAELEQLRLARDESWEQICDRVAGPPAPDPDPTVLELVLEALEEEMSRWLPAYDPRTGTLRMVRW